MHPISSSSWPGGPRTARVTEPRARGNAASTGASASYGPPSPACRRRRRERHDQGQDLHHAHQDLRHPARAPGTRRPRERLPERRERHHGPVSYTHLRAHETRHDLVCRLLLEKKNKFNTETYESLTT